MTDSLPAIGYAPAGGLDMYYEIHGAGEPLVLLHGGLLGIDTSFGTMLQTLAETRQVIALEQQAHGHTADIDRPMSFTQMADDTAAALRYLAVGKADLFGYSDGGNVALGVAIRHPELVRRVAVAGTNFSNDGLVPGMLDLFTTMNLEDDFGGLKQAYEQVAPRPEDWPVMVRKVMDLAVNFPGWSASELRAIQAPALVIAGDADIVRAEHAVELYRLIPNCRLAILPGTDHGMRLDRPQWLLSMLLDFLGMPIPAGEQADDIRELHP